MDTKPTKVSILGKTFKIEYPTKVDKDDSLGECDGAHRTIRIKAKQPQAVFEDTLLHEIIHAVLYISGAREHLSDELEESIVVALESGLSQVYKRKF